MKKLLSFLLIFIFLFTCCACRPRESSSTFYAMDTVMELRLLTADESVLRLCREEITRLEELFSFALPSSDIGMINSRTEATVSVHAETAELLRIAKSVSSQTDGCFDVTVFPLVHAWGFDGIAPKVPSEQALTAALSFVGHDRMSINQNSVTLAEGQAIDLGAIAKGYASDRLAQLCRETKVHGVLSLGGNVMAVGTRADGSPWRIGIADPRDPQQRIGTVSVSDKAVITAGSYQRNFTSDGTFYHHILDPHNGYPASGGLLSVSVVGTSGTLADAYSTALFVMGTEKAIAFLGDRPDLSVILITKDTVYVTSDLKNTFLPESDLPITYIR